MTVNREIPVIKYVGNAVTTNFPFSWSSDYANEIYVEQDGVLLKEGVEYELEEYTEAFGGEIVFIEAPIVDSAILIYRKTPITQQVDYVEADAFQAETHEGQMDKDTRILQEIIDGGAAVGGRVDLKAVPDKDSVVIENTGGLDADILPWTTDGLLAGSMTGDVMLTTDPNVPLDGTVTTKPDGHIYWIIGPTVAAGGDPTIVMFTNEIVVNALSIAPIAAKAAVRYNALTGKIEIEDQTGAVEQQGISPIPTALQQYWLQFEVLTGAVLGAGGDVWVDAYTPVGQAQEFWEWYVADPEISQAVTGRWHVAPDDGGGSPDLTKMVTRNVTLTATQG
jgi:hypothetical protein